MRNIVAYVMVTVDGLYEGANGSIDWHTVDEEFNDYALAMLDNADALLFGRITYQGMASYGPTPEAIADDPAVAAQMNALPKMVFSRTLESTPWGEWNNATLIKGDTDEAIARLKAQDGKDLVILGSGTLVASLTARGLIDEYRILVNPVVLGTGTPLFRNRTTPLPLTLVATKTFQSGLVALHYIPTRA